MSREDLLYDCVCPVCEERFDSFQDLHIHLLDHFDSGDMIAEDFIDECVRLAAAEEFEDEDEWNR